MDADEMPAGMPRIARMRDERVNGEIWRCAYDASGREIARGRDVTEILEQLYGEHMGVYRQEGKYVVKGRYLGRENHYLGLFEDVEQARKVEAQAQAATTIEEIKAIKAAHHTKAGKGKALPKVRKLAGIEARLDALTEAIERLIGMMGK